MRACAFRLMEAQSCAQRSISSQCLKHPTDSPRTGRGVAVGLRRDCAAAARSIHSSRSYPLPAHIPRPFSDLRPARAVPCWSRSISPRRHMVHVRLRRHCPGRPPPPPPPYDVAVWEGEPSLVSAAVSSDLHFFSFLILGFHNEFVWFSVQQKFFSHLGCLHQSKPSTSGFQMEETPIR